MQLVPWYKSRTMASYYYDGWKIFRSILAALNNLNRPAYVQISVMNANCDWIRLLYPDDTSKSKNQRNCTFEDNVQFRVAYAGM